MSRPLILSVGTTHPWSIAGVGLDARVAAEYEVDHAVAIAAVSAQDADGVRALHVVPPEVLEAQLECIPGQAAALRIGALGSAGNVCALVEYLRERAGGTPVVVDPVLGASLGGRLDTEGLLERLRDDLLKLPVIVTPNAPEARLLTGIEVRDERSAGDAGARLVERGAYAALVKGGHLDGPPLDVLVTREGRRVFHAERLPGSMRGTGCTLAASLACELARGAALSDAVESARAYVRAKIAAHRMRYGLQVAF